MKQFAFPLGDQPALTIRSHADLTITGWDRADASVDSEPGYSLKVEHGRSGLHITCLDNCAIFIPVNTHITIEKVSGDFTVSNLAGPLSIEKIGGSAVFTQIASVSVAVIGGDCDVSGLSGPFTAGKIGGSLDASQFTGDLMAEKVGGDIHASGVSKRFIGRAGGSVQAQLLDGFGPTVQLRAGDDIRLQLPENDQGHFVLSSGAEEIKIDLPGLNQEVVTRFHEFRRGEGRGVEVELRSGGSITLTSNPIVTPVPASPRARQERSDRGSAGWEGVSRSTEEAISRAARSAEEALRQAERRVTGALRDLEGRGLQPEDVIIPPAPPIPPVDPAAVSGAVEFVPAADGAPETTRPEIHLDDAAMVSDQERLLILKMLQEKKITLEEAEALLEALNSPDASA